MNKADRFAAWRRLERVIEASGLSVNSFAHYVGLRNGENLYQIRKGNYGISYDLSNRIHDKFPQYPVAWLMCGESETVFPAKGDAPVLRIPVYRNFPTWLFPPKGRPDSYLILSAAEAGDARIAIPAPGGLPGIAVRELLVLLGEPQAEVEEGKACLVVTNRLRLVCAVYRERHAPDSLRLKPLPPSAAADDLVVRRGEIRALWPVCGAVCKLE